MIEELDVVNLTSRALLLVLYLSLPTIIAAALVGVVIALLQALTQVQEQTLGMVFKLIAVVITLFLTAQWFGHAMIEYTILIFDKMGELSS